MLSGARSLFDELTEFVQLKGNVQDVQSSALVQHLSTNAHLFSNVLGNTGCDATHRRQVTSGETVTLSNGHMVNIGDELSHEAVIIADAFNCDELLVVELLLQAETHTQSYGKYSRGLTAILCYYDTHRYYSAIARTVIELRCNEQVRLSAALHAFVERWCSNTTLFNRLIALAQLDIQSELDMLHRPNINGLGDRTHQRLLRKMLQETVRNCNTVLYALCTSWTDSSSMAPLLTSLLQPLRDLSPNRTFSSAHLTLFTATLHLVESSNGVMLNVILKQLNTVWTDRCVQAAVNLACVVQCAWLNVNATESEMSELPNREQVVKQLPLLLDKMPLSLLRCSVLTAAGFRQDEDAFGSVHRLIYRFILLFSDQVVLLRRECEQQLQALEQLGSANTTPRLHYDKLLRLMADLYDDQRPCVVDAAMLLLSLDQMVNLLLDGKKLESPVLHITYLDMLKSLCKTRHASCLIFDLLLSHNDSTSMSLQHYSWAMTSYWDLLLSRKVPQVAGIKLESTLLSEQEVAGLLVWTQLVSAITLHNEDACRYLTTDSVSLLDAIVGLLSTAVPSLLKGAFYRLLAHIAKSTPSRVWTVVNRTALFAVHDGTLRAQLQELEECECSLRKYDASLGLLHLIKALFSHPLNAFDEHQIHSMVRFVSKSVLSQLLYRSYEDEQDMWQLCAVGCDALSNALQLYVLTENSLKQHHPQVFILTQVLANSPLFHSLMSVLLLGADSAEPGAVQCCLSVLHLLHATISLHAPLCEAVRTTKSTLIVSRLDSLLLAKLPHSQFTAVAVVASFLTQHEHLPLHALWAARIMHELTCCRMSIQTELTQALQPLGGAVVDSVTAITSPLITPMTLSISDTPCTRSIDGMSLARQRGETARTLIELCAACVHHDTTPPSLLYMLAGFDADGALLNSAGSVLSSVVYIVNLLIDSTPITTCAVSGLFEPTLRLLWRWLCGESASKVHLLRWLRSNHDLVHRLVHSALMHQHDEPVQLTHSVQRCMQGYILHLAAVEMHSLLSIRHYTQPARIYNHLCAQQESQRLLWRLLTAAEYHTELPSQPHLELLNAHKVDELVVACSALTAADVLHCNIEQMHSLLERESVAVLGEMQAQGSALLSAEMTSVLSLCVQHNLHRSLHTANQRVSTGWMAVLNVISLYSPLPFNTIEQQADILTEALTLLLSQRTDSASVSSCMCTITNATCDLYSECNRPDVWVRESVASLVNDMTRAVICSASTAQGNRMDMHKCVIRLLTTLANTTPLLLHDPVHAMLSTNANELLKLLQHDLCSSSMQLKVASLSSMALLLREDALGTQLLARTVSRSGVVRCVLEVVQSLPLIQDATNANNVQLLSAVLMCFIPLALCDDGWTGLLQQHTIDTLCSLPIWSNPPREVFTGTPLIAQRYLSLLQTQLTFCMALCGNPKWRVLSDKILGVVQRLAPLLTHMQRQAPSSAVLQLCVSLVSRIYQQQHSSRSYIERSALLNGLRSTQ